MTSIMSLISERDELQARVTKAEAERDWLADLAAKFSEYGACEICPAAGLTRAECNCAANLLTMAAKVTARREVKGGKL